MACRCHPRGLHNVPSRALGAYRRIEGEVGIQSVRGGEEPPKILYGCWLYSRVVSFCNDGVLCYDCVLLGFGLHNGLDSYHGGIDAAPGVIFGRLLSCDPNFAPTFGCGWLAPASTLASRRAGQCWPGGGFPP